MGGEEGEVEYYANIVLSTESTMLVDRRNELLKLTFRQGE